MRRISPPHLQNQRNVLDAVDRTVSRSLVLRGGESAGGWGRPFDTGAPLGCRHDHARTQARGGTLLVRYQEPADQFSRYRQARVRAVSAVEAGGSSPGQERNAEVHLVCRCKGSKLTWCSLLRRLICPSYHRSYTFEWQSPARRPHRTGASACGGSAALLTSAGNIRQGSMWPDETLRSNRHCDVSASAES